MKIKKIKIPIYFGELTIIQAKSFKKVEKKYKLNSLKDFEALTFRNHKKNGFSRYVLVFGKGCDARTIAHEALHAVALMYEDRHALLEIENDEPQCYLLGWIVGECHKFLEVDNSRL